jgi:peptidylprolyl isomerase
MKRTKWIAGLSILSLITSCILNKQQKVVEEVPTANVKTVKVKHPKPMKTASGLEYTITQKGNGFKPQQGDRVKVHYTGKLTNDTIFDSSLKGEPIMFKLGSGQVIKGWDEGIALLHVGDKATFRIPPDLAYGAVAKPKIPANSTLVFEVELMDVIPGPRPFDVKGKDTIDAGNGLKYVKVLENKDGQAISQGDKVTMHYTGWMMDGKPFDSSLDRGEPVTVQIGIGRAMPGWDFGIPLLKKGEKARFIIPAPLAFGSRQAGPIPPNSTIICDIEILDVKLKPIATPYDVVGKDTIKTASGLKYIVVNKGSGPQALRGNNVKVHYTGYLTDGKKFDSSIERDEPLPVTVGAGGVIAGWDEALLLMSVGDKLRLIVPYSLAYGENGYPGVIPPKADLIFDMELMEVNTGGSHGHDHNSHDGHHH